VLVLTKRYYIMVRFKETNNGSERCNIRTAVKDKFALRNL